jgi:hypothetical protein
MRTGQQLEAFSTTFGLLASVALHLIAFAYVASATAHFDFDFELTLPTEVEFGVADGMELAVAPTPAPSPAGTIETTPAGAPTDAVIVDAGVPETEAGPEGEDRDRDTEAENRKDRRTESDDPRTRPSGLGPSESTSAPVSAPALQGPSRLPPGAQLALRIDMKRVRESPLGPDVTQFLEGVPDWQLILDGSGIDPVADLDRLLVATPNLQRAKLVLAGKHRRDRSFARNSVKRLARARGKSVHWRQRLGVPTAPWHNRDRTPRTIALLSERHFSITRRQDVPRVLALARTRELRDAKKEGLVVARGPDALLSMGPGEALSLEVEGVHRFIVGSVKHVPVRLRIAVRETGSNEATVHALATYASPSDAEEAAKYWNQVAAFYSKQLVLTLAGFGKTFRRMRFEAENTQVKVTFKLNADQIRFILSYAEGRLRGSGGATRPRQPRDEW